MASVADPGLCWWERWRPMTKEITGAAASKAAPKANPRARVKLKRLSADHALPVRPDGLGGEVGETEGRAWYVLERLPGRLAPAAHRSGSTAAQWGHIGGGREC
jgi:hypothetical protein